MMVNCFVCLISYALLQKKQGAPVLESGHLDKATAQPPEEQEKAAGGWSSLTDVTRPSHIKAGNKHVFKYSNMRSLITP